MSESAPAAKETAILEQARRAARDLRWREAYDLLCVLDENGLTAEAFELFADAAWWCCRVEEELKLRRSAFAGFVADGEPLRAAHAAWHLSVRHSLRGEPVESSGWLQRAQRQLVGHPDGVERGYIACSLVEQALGRGDLDEAEDHARHAVAIGLRFDEAELVALAVTWQSLCRMERREVEHGLQLLDEAMASVLAGELDALFTGWVACFAVGLCMGVADLRRAGNWAQLAWDWASALPQETPYQGLCRVRQVEVMSMRGQLVAAAPQARRACQEMLEFEPNLAGEAFYVTGEILRRQGETARAEEAFAQARELGHDPQPGLARIRLAQGQVAAAAASLRTALADPGKPPFLRASLLAAQVEAAVADEDLDTAGHACDALAAIAAETASEALTTLAATTRGRLRLAEGAPEAALAALRPAASAWRALGMACDLAETRFLIGLALRALADEEGADAELSFAHRSFHEQGASADADRVAGVIGRAAARPRALTDRECQVLRLVASGHTNRAIAAELVLSEHTVARHLSNIYTKLGVSSRTAAAAFAFEHHLA